MTPGGHEFHMDAKTRRIDERHLRNVMGAFATGVAVVTTLGAHDQPFGLTVNSFNSVSLDPPLVLWSISLAAPSLAAFRSCDYFAVNVLAEDQEHLCRKFAAPASDKFAGVGTEPGIGGVPLILGAAAHMECRAHARYPGGDHEIHLGEILSLRALDREPLVVHRGAFRRLVPPASGQH